MYEILTVHLRARLPHVPRPFPPPIFDRILYAKTEGEGLGERVTCVTSGSQELKTVIFKRQCQDSSLSGRLEADQCRVCELQQSVTAPRVSTLTST